MLGDIRRSQVEKIGKILASLNIDETIFYQMGIFIALFFVLKMIFFEKLQEIITLREEKTIRRKESAEKRIVEAEEWESLYREKVKKADREGRRIYNRQKREIVEKEKARLKRVEDEFNVEFEKEVSAFKDEMHHQEKELLKNSDTMREKLVEKLVV